MAKKKRTGKKKYVNPVAQRKQQDTQYFNFFLSKLRTLCRQVGDESLFQRIPHLEKLVMYRFRGAPLKIMAAPGAKIHPRMKDALSKLIKSQQSEIKYEVIRGSGEMMTYADHMIVGMSLEYHLGDEKIEDYPNRELLEQFLALRNERDCFFEDKLLEICSTACWFFDDMENKFLYSYKYDVYVPAIQSGAKIPEGMPPLPKVWKYLEENDYRGHPEITLDTYPVEWRKIDVNGELHTAIPAGFLHYTNYEPTFIPFTFSPESPQKKAIKATSNLPVYIQKHAIGRMKERIGSFIPCIYKSILVEAILRNEITPITKTRMLIACCTEELKIGYFLAEILDGVLLIRTFLLLTNSGTPEGDKLAKLTKLKIEDRKYLAIDTLQGLANSDIEQNKAVCNLFCIAGCGSILELCKKINNDPQMTWLLDKSKPKNLIADLMSEYMQK
ncbi:MAG: hypothetical protein LBS12_00110 [Prevotellaceae bacterium]|jgi:hypothetical protein|nr:hypothetical protein [Prevotellaceae bacterium]